MEKFDIRKINLNSLENIKKLVLERPLIAFDLETTGTEVMHHEIIELMAIKIYPDGNIDKYYSLFKPHFRISEEVTSINGITNEMVDNEQFFENKADDIYSFFNNCDLFGFNIIGFDIPFLTENLMRCGKPYHAYRYNILDALYVLYKLEKRTLSAIYKRYFNEDMAESHNATADVNGALRIFDFQLKLYTELGFGVKNISDILTKDDKGFRNLDANGMFIHNNSENITMFGYGKDKKIDVKILDSKKLEDLKDDKKRYKSSRWYANFFFKKKKEKELNLV